MRAGVRIAVRSVEGASLGAWGGAAGSQKPSPCKVALQGWSKKSKLRHHCTGTAALIAFNGIVGELLATRSVPASDRSGRGAWVSGQTESCQFLDAEAESRTCCSSCNLQCT